jgi:hypothetical protein
MASLTSIYNESALALRFLKGLGSFLGDRGSESRCREAMTGGLAGREHRLMTLVRRSIFEHEKSPYLALFRHAGLDAKAVDSLVRDRGVDSALATLHDAGVYVSLDEFKGRRSIRRGSLNLEVSAGDFDNPRIRGHYIAQTGGSRGTGTRLVIDLDAVAHEACYDRELLTMFDLWARPKVIWRPVPPAAAGLKAVLRLARLGCRWDRWFSQTPVTRWATDWRHTLFVHATTAASRLHGHPLPRPSHVPIAEAVTVARWLADCVTRGTPGYLNAPVSSAVRVSQAATAAGLDLSGTFIRVGGEPLSPAKAAVLREAGCDPRPQYAVSEVGRIGMPCGHPSADDDLHVMEDAVALIERNVTTRRDEPVKGLVLTTLSQHAPKVLFNVEIGDTATLSRRSCGCSWEALGYGLHVQAIRSYDKLTSEGMHFMGADLITLVDETLPNRFGGSATDYQFVEEEAGGLTRVVLVVHPRVGPVTEADVQRTVLQALGGSGRAGQLMVDVWRDAGTLCVRRREPYLTTSGKILTLHVRTPDGSPS